MSKNAGGHDRLIKAQAGGFIYGMGIAAGTAKVFLGASDEERAGSVDAVESGEVEIAAIHDVEQASLPDELVEDVHVVNTGSGDNDDSGKVALKREQGVEFDGGFGFAERGPREQ